MRGPSAISFFRRSELLMIVVEFRMTFRINSSERVVLRFLSGEGGQNLMRFVCRTFESFETIP